jgi:rhamnosyltransferase
VKILTLGQKIILSGYKISYVADAVVYHSHSYSIWQEFKRYFDIGVFHKCESWILTKFGKAEGEGVKYIKSELNYLKTHKKWLLFPEFVLRNMMKYLGYKLGNKYHLLPRSFVKKVSMHRLWWEKYNNKL